MTAKIQLGGTNSDKYAIVDQCFYAVLNKFSWRLNNGYVVTAFKCEHMTTKTGLGSVQLHQMVKTLSHDLPDVCLCDSSYQLAVPKLSIDHINSDKLDNRLENLQYMTSALNNSKKGLRTGQTSQYNGVYWHKRAQKWQAQCQLNGKRIHIGCFQDELEAAQAHDAKCREHGLDRLLNF